MKPIVPLLALWWMLTSAFGQDNPLKLAAQARFDLMATAQVGAIDDGQILTDEGSFTRMDWIPEADQPRSYTVHFGAPHFMWSEFHFRFVPSGSGTVELRLTGPWEQPPGGGPIYRQELYWDALASSNATLLNGGFELVDAGLPLDWSRPYGDASLASNAVAAVDGSRYVRTWHDGPLTTSLAVTSGVPVTLRFFARAVVPDNFADMARIPDGNSPAHQAARKLMRGVNLGNYLEAPPGQDWGATYSTNDFVWIREEGFDHVRLPIGWHHYTGPAPDYTLSNEIFGKVDFLVDHALEQGLGVVVNIHHFDEFTSDPSMHTNQFYSIWRQIASHCSNAPPNLVFELINEPKDAATTVALNPIYAEAIRQIREISPNRTILVGPGQYNSIDELANLRLPDNDSNLVVTVHCYDPFLFTHQGATWAGTDATTTGIRFPGPPGPPLQPAAGVSAWVTNWIGDYNTQPSGENPSSPRAFQGRLRLARQWSEYYGRPVHIGEFGCYDTYCDDDSRVNYYRAFRETADELQLGWAMWDWKAGFHYWKEAGGAGAPDPPGMREALFPPPRLKATGHGASIINGASGKTYVFEKTTALDPTAWDPVSTQTCLASPVEFTDPDAGSSIAGFFRALWVKHP